VGDGTTEAVERLNTTSAARSIAATIEEVDAALARLEAGTYGVCARCGAAIPAERLDAVPWAAHCVDCGRALGR
jgi:RNA polymerase-binding transcription factor DksA